MTDTTKQYDYEIEQPEQVSLLVPIVGVTPLICHRFSEKAKRQMLDNQQGKKRMKDIRDPESEYEASLYKLKGEDGFGFPATAFKMCAIGAARFYHGLTMTSMRQSMFVHGVPGADGQPLVKIDGTPQMREDVVTVGRGSDLRYRGMFIDWTAEIALTFVPSMIDPGKMLGLIKAGGEQVGIGEWRPEKNGDFGTFTIDTTRDLLEITGDVQAHL